MVKPESYSLFPKRSREIEYYAGDMLPIRLERPANGAWFALVEVSLRFKLKDGRQVTIEKKLRLRGTQEGKRPHPNPFGRKKKK